MKGLIVADPQEGSGPNLFRQLLTALVLLLLKYCSLSNIAALEGYYAAASLET